VVARVEDLPAGQRKIVRVGQREIGVFHTTAGLFALRNVCPHQGAPLCLGPVTGTTLPSAPGEYVWGLEGRVLRCPWHGWEFNLETGVGLYDPYRHERVATYEVRVEGDEVVLLA
jgi:nitrite reductase/ring-hydroxylating ferredoxin subunit